MNSIIFGFRLDIWGISILTLNILWGHMLDYIFGPFVLVMFIYVPFDFFVLMDDKVKPRFQIGCPHICGNRSLMLYRVLHDI